MEKKDHTIENISLIITLYHRVLCESIEKGKFSIEELDIIKDQLELAKNNSRKDLSMLAYGLQIKLKSITEMNYKAKTLELKKQNIVKKLEENTMALVDIYKQLSNGNYNELLSKALRIECESNELFDRLDQIDGEINQYCIKLDKAMGDKKLKLTMEILHNAFDLKRIDISDYDLKDLIEWLFEHLSDEQLDEIKRSMTLTQPNDINVNTEDIIN